jgi:hypothetical protein
MPDVVPHGGKVPRSVSPPASRDTGVVRTDIFIFATQEFSGLQTINETLHHD